MKFLFMKPTSLVWKGQFLVTITLTVQFLACFTHAEMSKKSNRILLHKLSFNQNRKKIICKQIQLRIL